MSTFALTFTLADGSKRYDFCHSVMSLDEVRLHYRVLINAYRAGKPFGREYAEFVSVEVERQ